MQVGEHGNPFKYGSVAEKQYFTDRERELGDLVSAMMSGQDVLLISARRLGKTSLIKAAAGKAREMGALVAYADLFDVSSKDHLVRALAAAMFRDLESPGMQAAGALKAFVGRLTFKPMLSIGEDGNPKLEFPPAGRSDAQVDHDLERLFELPGDLARRRKKRVVLILDEFQEIARLDARLPALMRAAFQHQAEIAHVYAGSKHHLMHHLFTDRNQPFYRSAIPMPLGPIAAEDFARFIPERFAATGTGIPADAVDRILALTEGHPGDTQELCYFLWAEARATGREPDVAMVDGAVDDLLGAEGGKFVEIWDALPPHQRLLLVALAREPSKALADDYRLRHGLASPATVQSARRRLVERELIESRPDGSYVVADRFLRLWLIRLGEA